nr:winged helix-turn-helix transcriptional regulator [bacterium]
AVRDALARSLRARDPLTCKYYRRKAWMRLCNDSTGAANAELWRYTADLLYILDNPVWREAFFPTGENWLHVEPARSQDNKRISEIVLKHLDEESAAELLALLEKVPSAFSVVRGEQLECLGFYVAFDPSEIDVDVLMADSSSASWMEHLNSDPLPEGKRAFFIRRWLSDEHGESPSEIQAACWLDIKRTYMEMRPQLQRVYLTLDNPAPYKAVATELGFSMPPALQMKGNGRKRHGAVLNFGPGSVDGWLTSLLAAETGTMSDSPILDVGAQELITGDRRTELTRLEFRVLGYLMERPGKAVSRTSLLNDVWGLSYEGGSNVVDTVVAALRKKLGDYSQWIKTISGTGYSYRPPVG